MQAKKLIVYGDYLSQPFRAVAAFLKMNKIPHEEKLYKVMEKEHHKDEDLKKIHP